MATDTPHDNVKKIVGLLVSAVHMVKSPANRKTFFLMKGEQKMDKEKVKEKLKEQGLSDDEIAYIENNEGIMKILMDENNEKKALDIVKDGIRSSVIEIENSLQQSENINDLTTKIIKPFENLTNFLSTPNGDDNNNNNDNKSDDNKSYDNKSDDSEKDLENSVSELTNEISGLAQDVEILVNENDV